MGSCSPGSAGRPGVADDLVHAGLQEAGVLIRLVALDDGVVAVRHEAVDDLSHGATDADVVEGHVEDAGVLDDAVIGDDRDARVSGRLDRRQDGVLVLGEDDERVCAPA